MLYTMFRQAFLLSQYFFICVQYFKCSDTQYTQYLFDSYKTKQLILSTTLFLFRWRKLVPKLNSTFEQVTGTRRTVAVSRSNF